MDRTSVDTPDESTREVYTHGYAPAVQLHMAGRTAAQWASFFLPYLRRGMRVIDCGCGPGSITLGMAELVTPGRVVGVDLEPSQIAAASALAAERDVVNATFEVGNIYDLPFSTGSFDAAFAHTAIQHLHDPLRGLREIRRVLAPGGIVGLRDDDWGAFILEPSAPSLQLAADLHVKVWAHNGGDPFFGRKQRCMLRDAGFVQCQASASGLYYGTSDATREIAATLEHHHRSPAFAQVAIGQGWADEAALASMYAALRAWGEREDAFFAVLCCEAVAWAPA